jgi:Effector protein
MGNINFAQIDDYPQKMNAVYTMISGNPVGKVIIDDIKATSRDLTFKPRKQTDIAKYGVCDAGTEALDQAAAAPRGVGGKGPAIWYKGYPDDVTTRGVDERYEPSNIVTDDKGTGEGSSVEIGFDPDNYTDSCIKRGLGSQPDVVLLHEMVHALRMMQGQYNKVPTKNAFYDDEEEFVAIVIANVYLSQKDAAALLRGNHHDHERLWPPLNTSAGFVADKDNYNVLQIYRLTWLPTFTNLAMLVTPQFNPFREVRNKLGDAVGRNFSPGLTLSPPGTYPIPGQP